MKVLHSSLYRSRGITRREILVVLLIVAVFAVWLNQVVKTRMDDVVPQQTQLELERIANALHQYKLDNKRYPTVEQGLKALVYPPDTGPVAQDWNGPYLSREDLLVDPWKRPYLYDSSDAPPHFEIKTLGADGEEGGESRNADVLIKFFSDADY